MGMLSGKRGIVMGIANDRSIASGIAKTLHNEGATLGFSYLPDYGDRNRNEARVRQVTESMNPAFVGPCDVSDDASIEAFFAESSRVLEKIDFLIHSIAFAPTEDIKLPTYRASRSGFLTAMEVSCYSLLAVARAVRPHMTQGGSICAMTYYGGEKVMPGYNLMGICKSALDTAVRYCAYELGTDNIRVNAISAGPVKTLAASAVGDFKSMLGLYEKASPLKCNVNTTQIGQATAFLVSDYSQMTTGEILHVDAGFHVMGTYDPNSAT